MDSNAVWTISAVITLTAFIVSQIKIWLGNTKYLRAVPLILVAILVAMGVTVLAQTAGFLQGSLGQLLAQAVLAALGSGGLYNVITGSALQRIDETAIHPTTTGKNSVLVGEVHLADDSDEDHHGMTPLAPLVLLCLMLCSGCMGKGAPTAVLADPNATQNAKLYAAKQLYLSSLEFFTFLRDQHVVTQQWVNAQKGIFDDVQLSYKVWEQAVRDGGDTKSAEEKFNKAAAVLKKLREQYQPPSTQPAAKVNEYDDRGNHRAGEVPVGIGSDLRARAA